MGPTQRRTPLRWRVQEEHYLHVTRCGSRAKGQVLEQNGFLCHGKKVLVFLIYV